MVGGRTELWLKCLLASGRLRVIYRLSKPSTPPFPSNCGARLKSWNVVPLISLIFLPHSPRRPGNPFPSKGPPFSFSTRPPA